MSVLDLSNDTIVQVQADARHVLVDVRADAQADVHAHADVLVRALVRAHGGALARAHGDALVHVDAQARVLDNARDVAHGGALPHDDAAIHVRAHAPAHAHGGALGHAPNGDPDDALEYAPGDVQVRARTHAHAAASAPHDAVLDDAPGVALSGARALVTQAIGQGGQVPKCLSHGSCLRHKSYL